MTISLNLQQAPEVDHRPKRNNVWHTVLDRDAVLVFVHGFSDNSGDCWYRESTAAYWPDRVAATTEFAAFSIFLGGYETSKFLSGDYGIPDCADALFKALRLSIDGKRAVIDHPRIVFVCHSMGGLVTRYMLDFYRHSFAERTIGLFMIASPSSGSAWADVIRYISDTIGHEQLKTLAQESQLLIDLDRRFKSLVHGVAGQAGARLFGKEACETEGFKFFVPRIVSAESAGRYFGAVERLEGTDHRTCVKPDSDNHTSHLFLRQAMLDFFEFEKRTQTAPVRPVRTDLMHCGRLRRTVLIENDDGDARVETSLVRIVSAPKRSLKLRPVKIWSGYRSDTELVHEGEATTASISLGKTDAGEPMLLFSEAPQPGRPMNATWRYWTASIFSTNNRELRLKSKGSVDEEFVAVKVQEGQYDDLVMHIQLPEAMRIVGSPYAKVLYIADEKQGQLVDEKETGRTEQLVDYSPMLRTITWVVPAPLVDRSYRVCWRLADAPESPSQLTPQEQLQHMAFRARLLKLRASNKKPVRTVQEQSEVDALDAVVKRWQTLFAKRLNEALRWDVSDLTLMVLDDSNKDAAALLYTVGGLSASLHDDPLAVGEGNAGRAVKRAQTRVWDASDVVRYGYRPGRDGRQHKWLLSIPLIAERAVYGVVNLGTFDDDQVPVFKELETQFDAISAEVQPVADELMAKLGPEAAR